MTTVQWFGRNFPAVRAAAISGCCPMRCRVFNMRRVNDRDGQPCVFYFHPWEIDPQQPRQQGIGFKTRFRHYTNLGSMEGRLKRVLRDFAWDRMDRVFLGSA